MNWPKVSIIVPAYNAQVHLQTCINSLLNQSYRNLEIICIDDGSKDETKMMLEEYQTKDDRIQVIQQENLGVSAARNKGIERASGIYLMCCDADDYLEKHAVERCITTALSYETCDGVFFNATIFSHGKSGVTAIDGEPYKNIPKVLEGDSSEFLGVFTTVWGGMLSLELINKYHIRFIEGKIYEDWEFLGHFMSKVKQVIWLNENLYCYRRNHGPTISSIVTMECLDIFDTFCSVEGHYKKMGRWEQVQYSHYIKALDHLIYFMKHHLIYAEPEISTRFKRKVRAYISKIPYVMLGALVQYFDVRTKVVILSMHPHRGVEYELCKLHYRHIQARIIRSKMVRQLKVAMRKTLPAYRVSVSIREELNDAYWMAKGHFDYLVYLYQKNLIDMDVMRYTMGLSEEDRLWHEIQKQRKQISENKL